MSVARADSLLAVTRGSRPDVLMDQCVLMFCPPNRVR